MTAPAEPTAEQCTQRAQVGEHAYACWYPSMGGYVAKSVIVTDASDGDADVYVWHNGDFPFAGDGESPRILHHCSGDDFVAFGRFLSGLAVDW